MNWMLKAIRQHLSPILGRQNVLIPNSKFSGASNFKNAKCVTYLTVKNARCNKFK